jgi:hypothetical protein
MNLHNLLSSIDSEIARLTQARALLAGISAGPVKPKRTLSAAARKKIAAAQRRRWAAVKRAGKK